MNLLLEKLQANELQGAKPVVTSFIPDDQAASSGNVMDLNLNIQQKVDDLLSTGSGRNAAAKVDAHHLLLADGREPLILPESYRVRNNGILSDQDDMSDEGCNYYSSSVFSGYQKQQEEAHLEQWLDCVESILLPWETPAINRVGHWMVKTQKHGASSSYRMHVYYVCESIVLLDV